MIIEGAVLVDKLVSYDASQSSTCSRRVRLRRVVLTIDPSGAIPTLATEKYPGLKAC